MKKSHHVGAVQPAALFKTLPLEIKASVAMEWLSPSVHLVGEKRVVVGYLADDQSPQAPSEIHEGIGEIMFAGNGRARKDRQRFAEALAVDSYFDPDLELLEDFDSDLKRGWVEAASNCSEFIDWVDTNFTRRSKDDRNQGFYRWHAFRFWSACQSQSYHAPSLSDFDFTEKVKLDVWARLRSAGKIGNKHAVLLTHRNQDTITLSNQNASSGLPHDLDAPWLTTGDHGVWIPDDEAEAEIERRAKAYMFGQVVGLLPKSGKPAFYAVTDEAYGSQSSRAFDSFGGAFEWLSELTESLTPSTSEEVVAQAYHRARTELAQVCVDMWNMWANGEVYGQVVSTFENHGSSEKPLWEHIDSDSVWGYYGTLEAVDDASASAVAKAASLH